MQESQYRLVKHFAKPEPGEYVPIEYLEITTETVAWSSKLKQSMEKGGQILFSRKKMGRKTVSCFELSEDKEEKYSKTGAEIKSMLLSEKFEGEL